MPAGLSKEKVTRQNGDASIKAAVDGIDPPAGGRLIHDIIVNQRGRMDHFGDLGEPSVAG